VLTRLAALAGHEPCAPRRFRRTPRRARTALCSRHGWFSTSATTVG